MPVLYVSSDDWDGPEPFATLTNQHGAVIGTVPLHRPTKETLRAGAQDLKGAIDAIILNSRFSKP